MINFSFRSSPGATLQRPLAGILSRARRTSFHTWRFVGAGGLPGRLHHLWLAASALKIRGAPRAIRWFNLCHHRALCACALCKDLLAPRISGAGQHTLMVKTAGAQEGCQYIRAVGGGYDNDAFAALKSRPVPQQLVEGLLALIVAAAMAAATMAHLASILSIKTMQGACFCLVETYRVQEAPTPTNISTKIRTGNRRRALCFIGDGFGEGFTRAGWPDISHRAGYDRLSVETEGSRRYSTNSETSSCFVPHLLHQQRWF